MKPVLNKIAKKVLSWSNGNANTIAIYLPAEVVEREAKSSEDLIDYDLYIFHCACIEAWRAENHS